MSERALYWSIVYWSIVAILITVMAFGSAIGFSYLSDSIARDYVKTLEKQNQQLKVASLQKDIDYLIRENCRQINIRALDNDGEIKDVILVQENTETVNKSITVVIDGHQKSYDYDAFMNKVVKIECGDDFSW